MAARKKTKPRKASPGKGEDAEKGSGAAPAARPEAPPPGADLMGMEEAIALLKTTRATFYRWLRGGKIKGFKAGRQWRFERAEIERFLKGEEPQLELPVSIEPLVKSLVRRAAKLGVQDLAEPEKADLGNAVDLIINLAVAMRASDIHIEPFSTAPGAETVGVLRYRVDGVLHPLAEFDLRLIPALVGRFKAAAGCDVREKIKPQDGRILLDAGDHKLDLRLSFVGPTMGESVTVRILDPRAVLLNLANIDYTARDRERLMRNIRSPWGLVLVTGPTGCGKTTVLYACLNELAGPDVKTMSLEDPVEFLLPWVTQIGIQPSRGLTFERGIRAVLRSDPDVILVGEIRNRETLTVCQQAALTGHMVMTTLHTDEAASALKRMVEIGSEPFVVAEATRMVVAQRLVRKLCPKCSRPQQPSEETLRRAAELARSGGLGWDSLKAAFRGPTGCSECGQTGFKGRTVISEVLEITSEIGRALRAEASVDEIRSIAVSQGMTTLAADGIRRAAEGQVVLMEVLQILGLR